VPVPRPPHAGKAVAQSNTGCVHPPSNCPWTRPATHPDGAWIQLFLQNAEEMIGADTSCCKLRLVGARLSRAARGRGDPFLPQSYSFNSALSVLLLANFLAGALASERRFHAFLLTGFQVKGVALDFFNDVFLLYFALETAQSVFEGFPLLQSNFRQTDTPPNPSGRTQ
jgi:hypothetical protein